MKSNRGRNIVLEATHSSKHARGWFTLVVRDQGRECSRTTLRFLDLIACNLSATRDNVITVDCRDDVHDGPLKEIVVGNVFK